MTTGIVHQIALNFTMMKCVCFQIYTSWVSLHLPFNSMVKYGAAIEAWVRIRSYNQDEWMDCHLSVAISKDSCAHIQTEVRILNNSHV